ncbi:MAG TPA: hypothetical protein IAB06_02680 [Candidatus Avacidaminococcus intestinavium]|uniref:Uncharacterized protein n=1 Tax=Candidatus Avacidaminococcus intestinavium TaxID=2840684 RepID=A0A9D1SLF1_9FIRM|nr:hypothetical protein [Candidatus Avacidaminococcus intestinavium]
MELKKIRFSDARIKAQWQDLYCRNSHLFPYSSREYNELFNKYFRFDIKRIFVKRLFYGLYDEKQDLKLIVPLCQKKKNLYIFGDFGDEAILDFIYPENISFDYLAITIKELKRLHPGKRLILNRIAENSLLHRWLNASGYRSNIGKTFEYIELPNTIEEYEQKQPEDTRVIVQQVDDFFRKNALDIELKAVRGRNDEDIVKAILDLYFKQDRLACNSGRNVVKRLKQKRFSTLIATCTKGSFALNTLLYVNGIMSGVVSGFFDMEDRRFIAKKVVVDGIYDKQEVSVWLYSKTIEWLIENTTVKISNVLRKIEYQKFTNDTKMFYCYNYNIAL